MIHDYAAMSARNIGTDLLRTFIVLMEERSYTRAANRLGMSQPTVSAHIRRLQKQIGFDLFDKSVPGVKLTARGEITLSHSRQILTLHDTLIHKINGTYKGYFRIGLPSALGLHHVLSALADFRAEHPDLVINLHREMSTKLLDQVNAGNIDLCAALSSRDPSHEAFYYWKTNLLWIASPDHPRPFTSPVNIIGRSQSSIGIKMMFDALEKAGMDYRIVLNASDIEGAMEAVRAGMGISVLSSSADVPSYLSIPGDDAGLPQLGPAYWGIYINTLARSPQVDQLARLIAVALAPSESMIETGQALAEP